MPAAPYPVSGKVYDSDGTTVLASVRVVLTNVETNENMTMDTNASGEFIFDLTNLDEGFSNGNQIALYASYGRYYDEIYHTVDLSVGATTDEDLTLDHALTVSAVYCTISDVRGFTKAALTEWNDAAVYGFIKRATGFIDEKTGRTWKGVQTVTDEYYNGDDTDILWLNKSDIQSVTAVSIDNDDDGTYTSLTVADDIYLKDNSRIVIENRDAEVTSFTAGVNTVKVSYTWGLTKATETVKQLCILIIANWMDLDSTRSEEIERLTEKLKWKIVGGPI